VESEGSCSSSTAAADILPRQAPAHEKQ
jgi:hypothetical protein